MTKAINPVILCILDGWGYNSTKEYNAVKLANTPAWDDLVENNPHTFVKTDGEAVGLPAGQMGNSEVGHTNIGAGRVVLQDLPKISKAFKENEIASNPNFKKAISTALEKKSAVHIMGLCSSGGIHSHIDHMIQSAEIFAKEKIEVKLHLFTDGRDTPPESSAGFIEEIDELIKKYPNISIATVCGRYYAMDRDKRWERIELAYNAIALGEGNKVKTVMDAVKSGYKKLTKEKRIPSDEFITPSVIGNYKGIEDNDVLFVTNFRADRVRQILTALLDTNFSGFKPKKVITFGYSLGMVSYSKELDNLISAVFPNTDLVNTLGEVIHKKGLKQLRAAETEKYPHVTFFFNGGREKPFEGEDRILIPSPKVATYDLQPEMSAYPLKEKLIEAIKSKKYPLIVINFANGDMVGHTGVLEAAIKAIEAVDSCLAELKEAAKENNYTMLVTADHGNSENMWDYKNNAPHTQHTTNPVRLVMFNKPSSVTSDTLLIGKLADIAPTILEIMQIEQPSDMTGKTLLRK